VLAACHGEADGDKDAGGAADRRDVGERVLSLDDALLDVLVAADVADALRSLVAKGEVPAAWPSLAASRAEVPGPARVWR